MLSDGLVGPRNLSGRALLGLDSLSVVENVGACCCGHMSPGRRATPSPTQWQAKQRPPTTCPGSCPRLGCLPSGLCACVSPPPPDWAAGVVKGVTGAGSASGQTHTGEGLATDVGPQVSGEACRRGKQCSLEAQVCASWSPGRDQKTQTHQRIPEVVLDVNPITLHFNQEGSSRATD